MTTTEKTPLWLKLKKEYIDDNFDDFLSYMKSHCGKDNNTDPFYETSLSLLEEGVEALLQQMVSTNLYDEMPSSESCDRNIRLLACYLLVCPKGTLALSAYVALMLQLSYVADARFADALLLCAARRIAVSEVTSPGFSWEQVLNYKRDTFVYFALHNVKLGKALEKLNVYQNKGCAVRSNRGLQLLPVAIDKYKTMFSNGSESLRSDMNVSMITDSSDRLRQQKERDIEGIHIFNNDFINTLQQVKPSTFVRRLHHYADNDAVVVRVIKKKGDSLEVRTVNPDYDTLQGKLIFKSKSLVYYRPQTQILPYIKEGDFLNAHVLDVDAPTFSIEKDFVHFMVSYAENNKQSNILASIINIQSDKNQTVWLAQSGIVLYTEYDEEDQRDDTARLEIVEYGAGDYYGKINADVITENTQEQFSQGNAREALVRAFIMDAHLPVSKVQDDVVPLSGTFLCLMMQLLFARQKQIVDPVDRYAMLCQTRSLAVLLGDDSSAAFIRFTSQYLRALIQFVREGKIGDIQLSVEPEFSNSQSALIRISVLQLLREYDGTQDSPILQKAISDYSESIPMLSNLARLIQLSNGMKELVSGASKSVIKREIVRTLSLYTEEDADLEAATGNYLGVESDTVEFKQSFVFPPDSNMQPAPERQSLNVLRGICAFLNSSLGGTLYLGVNDNGYVTGIANDMKYLHITSIDAYMRYVQDVAKRELGLDAISLLHIEPLFDNQVVAIHVEPHAYRLVELKEKAYLRINAESREMPENVRQQIIARKVFTHRDMAAALSLLQHACSTKRTVILHQYSSNNSGTISDRTIEPFQIIPESSLVYGYNINDKCNKMYYIGRIGYVEVLDQKWQHDIHHKKVYIDDFHMTGSEPIHIVLKLTLAAHNLLVEEYPTSKAHLTADKNDPNIWYYEADVYKEEGIGRFCIGLANHIQILEGELLKQYIANFVAEYLK